MLTVEYHSGRSGRNRHSPVITSTINGHNNHWQHNGITAHNQVGVNIRINY